MLSGLQQKEHVLNRLGYGPSRWHSNRYDALGYQGFVDEQLDKGLEEISFRGTSILAKIDRAVLSRRQLEAVLLDFWFNHFNVDTKTIDPAKIINTITGRRVAYHQNQAIAPFVLGGFADMLTATAKSPSMLDYLDNRFNFDDEVIDGVQFGPNENYARELLELHTVGIDGGFSEADVANVALILTGWSVKDDDFGFRVRHHNMDSKRVLGRNYPADRGIEEGEELLQRLASHNATAHHLCGKLVERFVDETQPAGAQQRAVTEYENTGGDLKAVLRALFDHADFLNDDHFRSKIKPPHRFLASALLAMGVREREDYDGVRGRLANLVMEAGEVPYVVGPPTGYPDRSAFWVSGPTMVTRFKIAEVLAYDDDLRRLLQVRLDTTGSDVVETLTKVAEVMVPGGMSDETRLGILDHMAANATTNNARISAAAHLVLCSPEFVRY